MAPFVTMVCKTWTRDSHELFDFEARALHSKTFTTTGAVAVRSGSEVELQPPGSEIPSGSDALVQVVSRGSNFYVDRATSSSSQKRLWMVVRDVAPTGYELSEGDVIKLGRLKLRLRQMVTDPRVAPALELEELSAGCEVDPAAQDNSRLCRICLMEGPGEQDPLIAPCSCKGSIEFVHLKCLRHWTTSRLRFPSTQLGSYFYRPLACELCKTIYPGRVTVNGQQELLVELPVTQPPFIVLEAVKRERLQSDARGLHVMSLAGKAIVVGRGHESDIRISDVSMSRSHASIRFQNGSFLLQDNNSKFGTLVAMRRPRQLEGSSPLCLQIGRTVLSLVVTTQSPINDDEDAATTVVATEGLRSPQSEAAESHPSQSSFLPPTVVAAWAENEDSQQGSRTRLPRCRSF
mmetsp:Transcript_87185/g.182452  ORF Transcript_87185/g.182452 Transcript_87185/m.182452 type:complete len:405 (-) Transcript_87185:372-1586(-)